MITTQAVVEINLSYFLSLTNLNFSVSEGSLVALSLKGFATGRLFQR